MGPLILFSSAVLGWCIGAGCQPGPCRQGFTRGEDGICLPMGDSGAPSDTAGPDDTGSWADDPWDQDGYWTGSSVLDGLLDTNREPTEPYWQVVMNVSTSGWAVGGETTIVATNFSSLDLLRWGDEALVLLGGVDFRLADLGAQAEDYRYGYLYALTTPDLAGWGTRLWAVNGTSSGRMTDAALQPLDDGRVRAVYYSTPEDAEGDPALIAGEHPIKVAWREGDSFMEWPDPVYSDAWLVDPVICTWDGLHHLFATRDGEVIHATSTSGIGFQHDDAFQWSSAQVPFCFEHGGVRAVVAQAWGGLTPPEAREMATDGSFGPAIPLWGEGEGEGFVQDCTSPVMAYFQDRYVTFCAALVVPEPDHG